MPSLLLVGILAACSLNLEGTKDGEGDITKDPDIQEADAGEEDVEEEEEAEEEPPELFVEVDPVQSPTMLASQAITGRASPGSSISITISEDAFEGEADPDEGGFSIEVTLQANRSSRLRVFAEARWGDTLGPVEEDMYGDPLVIVHDDRTPSPPSVDPVTSPTNDPEQTITGKAEPESEVFIGGGTATISSDTDDAGDFFITVFFKLNETNTLYAWCVDAAGNESDTIDIDRSGDPLVVVHDDIPPALQVDPVTSPTARLTQTITGASEPEVTVVLARHDMESAMEETAGTGAFSIDVDLLTDTLSEFTAHATDRAGNASDPLRLDILGDAIDILHNSAAPEIPFREGTDDAGLTGLSGGQGASLADVDNDGDLDLLASGSRRLYLNNGDGTFEVLEGATFNITRASVWGDYDNDGDLDLFVTNGSNGYLYHNEWMESGETNVAFTEVTAAAGISNSTINNSEGAAWLDYNTDGFVDLFIQDGNNNLLYENKGDGTFEETGVSVGASGPQSNGSWVAVSDFLLDGSIDILVADNTMYRFYFNLEGMFGEVSPGVGLEIYYGDSRKRGSSFGDFDNDGDFDLYAAMGAADGSNTMFLNEGIVYSDAAVDAGLAADINADGVAWGDMDHDGDLDLFIGSDAENALFLNRGDLNSDTVPEFEDVAPLVGVDATGNAEAVLLADLDGDGDLDIFVVNAGAQNLLYFNDMNNMRHLMVTVRGSGGPAGSSVDAVGSIVYLYDPSGTLVGAREVNGGRGNGSQDPHILHFGGISPSQSYEIVVTFPNGSTISEHVTPMDSDWAVTVQE